MSADIGPCNKPMRNVLDAVSCVLSQAKKFPDCAHHRKRDAVVTKPLDGIGSGRKIIQPYRQVPHGGTTDVDIRHLFARRTIGLRGNRLRVSLKAKRRYHTKEQIVFDETPTGHKKSGLIACLLFTALGNNCENPFTVDIHYMLR